MDTKKHHNPFKSLLVKISNSQEVSIDHSILNSILFLTCFCIFISETVNLFLEVNPIVHLVTNIIFVIISTLYLLARFKNVHQYVIFVFFFIIQATLSILWFFNGGIDGPNLNYFFLLLMGIATFLRGSVILYLGILILINLTLLIVVEYHYPNLVVKYPSQALRYWDIGTSNIIILSITIIVVRWLKFNYDKEKQKTDEQKELILEKSRANEVLLTEVHHRVNNNLQVISSLLSLQERHIKDENAKKAIFDSKERVKSMGLIHKMLYQEKNFAGVEMNLYINSLLISLLSSYGISTEQLNLNTNFSPIKLSTKTAIPIGLIVNELFTNCIKHAYSIDPTLTFTVYIGVEKDCLILVVADTGKVDNRTVENKKGFGLQLIDSLSKQLKGKLEIINEEQLTFYFKIYNYEIIS